MRQRGSLAQSSDSMPPTILNIMTNVGFVFTTWPQQTINIPDSPMTLLQMQASHGKCEQFGVPAGRTRICNARTGVAKLGLKA